MKKIAILASVLVVLAVAGAAFSQRNKGVVGPRPKTAEPPRDECGPRRIVEIREADPKVDKVHHDLMRDLFARSANQQDTTILLGPNVVLDFSELQARHSGVTPEDEPIALPIEINRCVSIRSVAWFGPSPTDVSVRPDGVVFARDVPPAAAPSSKASTVARRRFGGTTPDNLPDTVLGEPPRPRPVPEARSSMALGPLLKYGPHRSSGNNILLEMRCFAGAEDRYQADHIRISGFRIFGPEFGQQKVGDKGILIDKCVDVEISNMEIAGFGGEGIRVQDDGNEYLTPPVNFWQPFGSQPSGSQPPVWPPPPRVEGICREAPYNGPNGRIGSPDQVRIIGNFIHNNQQPSHDGHAGGYGVEVTDGT